MKRGATALDRLSAQDVQILKLEDLLALGLADRARKATHRSARGLRAGVPSLLESRAAIKRELTRSAARSTLDRRAGPARTIALAAAPLAECKRAGKAIDEAVTLNDVALAIVAGGVRAWLEHGRRPEHGIRVKVPVCLHGGANGDAVANRDSYFFVDLPVSEADPAKRLLAISCETRERKLHRDAEALFRLSLHRPVASWAMSPRVFTFNVSNVPGPRNDVYVLGARVRELYSLAEIAQHHALRVAVISAAGTLFFGLCADRDAVPDLDAMAEGLRRSTEELLRLGG